MTLSEWLPAAARRLASAGVQAPQLEAQLLAAHLFRSTRVWVVAHPEAEINPLAAEHVLQRREAGEPLAYILGSREFYGRTFAVNPGVLIPRQETEMLVELAPRFVTAVSPNVLDVGTGSGCIAITLKLENPNWQVVGLDISELALEVARDNSARLQAGVQWIHSDIFAGLDGATYDLVVTNPPYVERDADLPREVAEWEPSRSLFALGETLSFYRRLAHEAPDILKMGGALLTEIGAGQASQVQQIFASAGWASAGAFRDLAGIERVLAFHRPKKGEGSDESPPA